MWNSVKSFAVIKENCTTFNAKERCVTKRDVLKIPVGEVLPLLKYYIVASNIATDLSSESIGLAFVSPPNAKDSHA